VKVLSTCTAAALPLAPVPVIVVMIVVVTGGGGDGPEVTRPAIPASFLAWVILVLLRLLMLVVVVWLFHRGTKLRGPPRKRYIILLPRRISTSSASTEMTASTDWLQVGWPQRVD
jgi:hypothetical protein